MRIVSLALERFRSYQDAHLAFDPSSEIHLLLGPNGAGKTNLLEAVSVLSTGKSCLGNPEREIIRWGAEYYRLRAETRSDDGETVTLEIVSQITPKKEKAFFLNDVRVPSSQCTGKLPTVIFLPQDLRLFTGSPARRREFLRAICSQSSPEYAQAASVYERTLKQRNALLQKIAVGLGREADLHVWDEQLAVNGAVLMEQHAGLLEILGQTVQDELRELGEAWETVALVYASAIRGTTLAERTEALRVSLRAYRDRDLQIGATTVGPHRDDWRMEADGRPLQAFASRGEQRTAVLALLNITVAYLRTVHGENPVVLLDDAFSELDSQHQELLLQALRGSQVFITATHLPEDVLHEAKVYEVREGRVLTRK